MDYNKLSYGRHCNYPHLTDEQTEIQQLEAAAGHISIKWQGWVGLSDSKANSLNHS